MQRVSNRNLAACRRERRKLRRQAALLLRRALRAEQEAALCRLESQWLADDRDRWRARAEKAGAL